MWVIIEDRYLVNYFENKISNKGRAKFSQRTFSAAFFHCSATEAQRKDFLQLILLVCEDIIGELLGEKILD